MPRPVPPLRDTRMTLPRLADDVRLLGSAVPVGLPRAALLIERPDQRMLQLSRLLFIVAANLDGRRSVEEIADRVSTQYRRRLTTEDSSSWWRRSSARSDCSRTAERVDRAGARPLRCGAPPGQPAPAGRLLGLRLRLVLLPARLVGPCAGC